MKLISFATQNPPEVETSGYRNASRSKPTDLTRFNGFAVRIAAGFNPQRINPRQTLKHLAREKPSALKALFSAPLVGFKAFRLAARLQSAAVVLVALFLLTAFQSFPTNTPDAPTGEPLARRVILISVDGLRPDAIASAPMPTLITLAENGASAFDAQTVYPSVTLPAHASMLTGLSIEAHGLNHNDNPTVCEPISAPTFLTSAAQAGFSTAMVVGKEKFCLFNQTELVDYTFAREGDRSVVDRAIELIEADTQVLFVHLPNADYFGHSTGWMSDTYLTELQNTDAQIARLIDAVDAHGTRDETLIIVTSDHGGHDVGHGTDLPEDMTIPFIIAGSNVTAGTIVEDVRNADAAPTLLAALGIDAPEMDLGRVLTEAFYG